MDNEDWRAKLAQSFNLEVPKEEEKKTDWNKKAEQYKQHSRQQHSGGNGNRGYGQNRRYGNDRVQKAPEAMASAPYNFITLPTKAIAAPLDTMEVEEKDPQERYRKYVLKHGLLNGFIELEIETVTPCFVGGNDTEFFGPQGQPVIPGSTLRGMTKNLYKIITCGAMRRGEDVTDRHLYSRGMAGGVGTFRDYYKNRMTETDAKGKMVSKAKPGFLICEGGNYYICPADKDKKKIPDGVVQEKACIRWHAENGSADIETGRSPQKKYIYYTIQNPDWRVEKRLAVDKKIIEDYQLDKSKNRYDLFGKKHAKWGAEAAGFTHQAKVDFVVPCFYMDQNGAVQHFGHGRYYRIPYETSVGDHIPEAVQNEELIDFADAVFGRKGLWSSRVFFEDAELQGKASYLQKNRSHPLMSPNPTSFQLYLEQSAWPPKHWDDKVNLRGYKMYWHQKQTDRGWMIDPVHDKAVTGTNEIHPLAKGSQFKSRIRFQHLSPIELGALCEVFSLADKGEGILYKIGRGKSIGLGSIRIKASLKLENQEQYYQHLFSENGWEASAEPVDSTDYRQAFTEYRADQLGAGDKEQFDKVLGQLLSMMDWKNVERPDWEKKTAMMKIGDTDRRYKDRAILSPVEKFITEKFR